MGRISALTELTSLAPNDYIIALDSSANIAKKITVANAFGIPEATWTATGETWVYASATTITVPSDATAKYSVGMLVKVTQVTGGTKIGVITAVASTLLTIKWKNSATLANETISTPYYSALAFPYGAGKLEVEQIRNSYAKASSSGSQTVSNTSGTTTDVTLVNTEINQGGYSLSSNGITVPESGVYLLLGEIRCTDVENFFGIIAVNGSLVHQLSFAGRTSTSRGYQASTGGGIRSLSAGDVIKLRFENRAFATSIVYAQLTVIRLS